MTSKANDIQIAGNHYKKMPIEHWDLAVLFDWDPFQYQITKYVMRWRDKNGIEDLEKVLHFAQKYLEVERERAAHSEAFKARILHRAYEKARVPQPQPRAMAAVQPNPAHLAEPDDSGSDEDLRQSMRDENDREPQLSDFASERIGAMQGHARPTAAFRATFGGSAAECEICSATGGRHTANCPRYSAL